ncbi:MAG TPA: penicillin-binding transpeptidase domain-containing protein [Kofleriaceae bacterium]|nr:penicillin-binding transpeptidase domain-containing protein [Kofleriaceae bacterium]
MRRAQLVIGGLAALGATAWLVKAGAEPSSAAAQLGGAPLDPAQAASEAAAFANLADQVKSPDAVGKAGTLASIPAIDLDSIQLAGDHYTAKLADGRIATLTLEPDLQQLAEKLLDESRAPRGAIVAMAPDGRILALAGRRTEEPKGSRKGTFDWRLATEAWAPSASVFKLVTATALVQAGVDPDGRVCFHGGIRSVLEHNLRDDKRDSRCESLAYGVAHSNNAILGKLAYQNLEPKTLEESAKKLGWLSPLPELKGIAGALALPSAKDLEFARAAAGFSNDNFGAKLSVLGGALVTATFAKAGEQPAPQLVAAIDGKPVPVPAAHRVISADTARAVARMMVQTCDDGSAAKSFGRGREVKVAGKTGTLTKTDPFYMEHSWFVGFAPADKPEIIVSVLLGNPESWHLRGHEAARRLIDRVTNARLREQTSTRRRGDRS